MNTPDRKKLLVSLAKAPRNPVAARVFVDELLKGFTADGGGNKQGTQSPVNELVAGKRFRIIATAHGDAFQVKGVDGIWHTHLECKQPLSIK